MRRAIVLLLVTALCLVALGSSGCYRKELPENQKIGSLFSFDHEEIATGPTTTRSVTVPLENATELDVSVRMGAGHLALKAGGADALEADFEYRPKGLSPDVSYEVASDDPAVGSLTVRQPARSALRYSNARNSWVLRLAEGIPLDLDVELGAGESDLALGGLGLRQLRVNVGAGGTTLDFGGRWDHDVDAEIDAGVGQLILRLPQDVGVRVNEIDRGIGKIVVDDGFVADGRAYVNRAYGETTTTIEISVRYGVGEVRLETVR